MIAKGDVCNYLTLKNKLCPCLMAEIEAFHLTDKINETLYQEFLERKYNTNG